MHILVRLLMPSWRNQTLLTKCLSLTRHNLKLKATPHVTKLCPTRNIPFTSISKTTGVVRNSYTLENGAFLDTHKCNIDRNSATSFMVYTPD